MNAEMENVMRRIQKLLAIANDSRADANEAASAAGMAERLMRKFQLDNADVLTADLRAKRSRAIKSPVFASMKRDEPQRANVIKVPSWAQHIAVAVARLHDCEVRMGRAQRPNVPGKVDACLFFFGMDADVSVACWTFDYLVGAMLRAVARFNADAVRAGCPSKAASESYRRGFVAALTGSLCSAAEEKSRAAYAGGTALIVAKRAALTEEFGEFRYAASKAVTIRNAAAFIGGRNDGAAVDVARRAVGSEARATLAIAA